MSLIPELLKLYPDCHFAFMSSRSVDFSNSKKLTEALPKNQRFRIYTNFIQDRIANITFTHFEYPSISSYLLINNCEENIDLKELKIKEMFERTYSYIPDLDN